MSQLEHIAEYLEKLQGEAYLQVQEGPLKDALMAAAAAEQAEQDPSLPHAAGEVEIVVGRREGDREPLVALRLKEGDGVRLFEVAARTLRPDALEEISAHLVRLAEKEESPAAAVAPEEEEGEETFGMVAAANRLRVSTAWLKSVIPCTYYTYEEIDGRKKIKEYFWSRELIRLLHQLRSKKVGPEEVQFIADHCCEGDVTWSREIIGRLKSYSRGEGQQQKVQQQKPQQQKPVQQQAKAGTRPRGDAERGRRSRTP